MKTLASSSSKKKKNLWDVPGLRLGNGDDHTLEVAREDDLAAEPGVLVENPSPGVPLEDVLLVVGARGELLEPLLGDVDLALGGAGVDLLQAVGGRVDQAGVGQGFEESVAGQAYHLPLLAVQIDGEELHDAIGDLLRGRRRRRGRGGGGG